MIIGGSYGISEAIARRLITKNYEVITLCRTAPSIPEVTHISCDVNSESFPDINDDLNGIVYCPGTLNLKPFKQLKIEDFQRDLEINFLGAVRAVKSYLSLLQGGHSASLLFFSTVAVQKGMPFHTSTAAAKGAVEGMTRSLAAELSPQVRVNCIAPSLTETPLASSLIDRGKDSLVQRHPLKRLGAPNDIAAMAEFLLSGESEWITGQVFGVDGGISTLSL